MTGILIIVAIIVILYLISKSKSARKPGATGLSPPSELSKYPAQSLERKKLRSHKSAIQTDIDLKRIELNDDFKKAIDMMENNKESVYITGNAGTGKSTLLKYFRFTTKKNVAVLAPTGLAAINIGGQTIHSFFKFPPKLIKTSDIKRARNALLFKNLDAIVIDEVSMVRADLMDGIDYSLRLNRGNMDIPFGGVQMVFFGDLFQLPPVVKESEEQKFIDKTYGGPYFFCSTALKGSNFKFIDLKKIYRQVDSSFVKLLNGIRENKIDSSLLDFLNSRVISSQKDIIKDDFITLTTTNEKANNINESFLNQISDKEFVYQASIKGEFKSAYPTEPTLRLKKGARVMLLKNDPGKRWVNGTICTISSLNNDNILVDIRGESYEVIRETWEKIKYDYDRDKNRIEETVIGSFTQFPIRLAWAITIHKSQGQTFDKVFIDLGEGAFTHGQTYVALSRSTSFEGIKLKRPVYLSDVIFDPRVYEYSRVFNIQ